MIENLQKTSQKVYRLLKDHQKLRDSDKLLWLAYLCKHHNLHKTLGPEAYLALKNLVMRPETPPMESIRRMRQKIQEDGFFQGLHREERLAEARRVHDYLRPSTEDWDY